MKGIRIFLVNNLPYGSRLFADGKEIKAKKNRRGGSEIFVETENKTADIRVLNVFDGQLSFFKWFAMTFVCWVLSVFGLFDSVTNPKGRTVEIKLDVKTSEDAFIKLKFNIFKNESPAAEITETNTDVNEISNVYFTDQVAKKRNKYYKVWRVVSIVAAAVIAVAILIVRG